MPQGQSLQHLASRAPASRLTGFSSFLCDHSACWPASHGSCTAALSAVLLRPQRSSPPAVASGRQPLECTRRRRRESPNQPASTMCGGFVAGGTDGRELATAASAALDKVLRLHHSSSQRQRARHCCPASCRRLHECPPLPLSHGHCSCATCTYVLCLRRISSLMAQYSFMAAPRWLRGDLQVYGARGAQIAGGGAAHQGPNRPCASARNL